MTRKGNLMLTPTPKWMEELFKINFNDEDFEIKIRDHPFVIKNGILRSKNLILENQSQTKETFSFKWKKEDTFSSKPSLKRMKKWLIERYGNIEEAKWFKEHGQNPLLLDAGCGAGMSALELLSPIIPKVRYLGVDVSDSVDIAKKRFLQKGHNCGFIQCDLNEIPLIESSVDLIFSEGVLHHTNSTEKSLKILSRLLKPGGRFLFYVYKKKGPIREFTDDYIRNKIHKMEPNEAWKALEPLTELGIELSKIDKEINIDKKIDLLEIPAGKISVQRLFYWHVAKMFYDKNLTFEEMNHINFDWYMPSNASRHSLEEILNWCEEAKLFVEKNVSEDAGITIIAKKNE